MTRQVHGQALPIRSSMPPIAPMPLPEDSTRSTKYEAYWLPESHVPSARQMSSCPTQSTPDNLDSVREIVAIGWGRQETQRTWMEYDPNGDLRAQLISKIWPAQAERSLGPAQRAGICAANDQATVEGHRTRAEHCLLVLGHPVSKPMIEYEPSLPICPSCYLGLRDAANRKNVVLRGVRHDIPGPAVLSSCPLCDVARGEPSVWATPYCRFMTENPTVFHVVAHFEEKLSKLGFIKLPFRDNWIGKLEAGGKYFVTRNGSTMAAFVVGKKYVPGNGVAMIGGHIDALTARLKPVSTKATKAGYVQLGVAPYAGGLNETWWDRDLTIGGRVVVQDPKTSKTTTKLVKLGWPIARIPTLAPHFGVGIMGDMNKETQVVPVIGLEGNSPAEPLGEAGSFIASQPPRLVQLIAKELGIRSYSTIINWELELFDPQPATVGGMDREFIFAGRIDDKLCSWSAMTALMHADAAPSDGTIKLTALFDDEEIGSLLRQGAKSNFLPSIIERTVEAFCSSSSSDYEAAGGEKSVTYGPGVLGQTYARSFFVSSDVCHAVNPNFLEKYLENHAPQLNVGVVVAADSNGHMTTDSVSTAICNRVAVLAGTTNQVFMIRNDSRSGGTIGPSLSSMMGVKSADVGIPQLSMHSIRATTGSLDPGLGLKFFKGFLDNWEKIDAEWHE